MDAFGDIVAGIKHVDSLIDEDVLEPDPGRDDWPRMKARIALVEEAVEQQLLATLDDAVAAADTDAIRELVKRRVAGLVGAASALRFVSGNRQGGFEWAKKAAKIASDPDQQSELAAAGDDPEGHVLLWHGRWLQEHGRRADADRVMKRLVQKAKAPALRDAGKKGLRAPRPLTSAPPLFRLNGCGVGLYGQRDRRPDGSYIATYCLSVLFIPVLPLTAYRVRDAGDNRFQFSAREYLSPLMRGIQIAMLSGVVLAVAWSGVASWLDSPSHKASVALGAAKAAEASGDREAAIAKYTETIQRFGSERDVDLDGAAEAVVRLAAAGVAEPCTAASVEKIGRVVNTFYELPAAAREGKAGTLLAQKLAAWAAQIGEATEADAGAALTVLDLGGRVAGVTSERAKIEAARIRIRRALADRVVAQRPLRALVLYVEGKDDPESITRAGAILATFGDAPSLWLEAEHEVDGWIAASVSGPTASGVREKLANAHTVHVEDTTLIEAGDEKVLVKALAARPADQELAVAVAGAQRRRGDAKGALKTLEALGPKGRMTTGAQLLLAACAADAGDLARADTLLTAFLADRLAPFQEAQRDYAAAVDALEKKLIADARANVLDAGLRQKLEGASEAEQPRIFRAWMSERIDKDPELGARRAEYLRHGAVIGASLSLGTIELRRANESTGEARKALLGSAERVFLAIRQEAEGDPSFHLGLGQVFHRLGRTDDGNVELGHVLEKKDPMLTLSVVSVYRDLGLPVRAKQIAEELYASPTASKETKEAAASLLAHLVNEVGFNEADEEMWLRRANAEADGPKTMLLQLEARRLNRDGKTAEADRAYARVAEIYERDAKHSSAAANNAAVAYLDRFRISGDPAHMRAALKHLESARRLSPQSAMVVGNLADALELSGLVTVLERWVRTRPLQLDGAGARSIVSTLLAGSIHDEVLAALKQDTSLHRSLELGQEEQTLAPQKVDAYRRQMRWLDWTDDDAGMMALAKRLDAMPPFDAENRAAQRRDWESKSKDLVLKPIFDQEVSQAKEALTRAQRAGHTPTLASAWMLLGESYGSLLTLDPTPANVDAMIDAERKGADAWPEGGMAQALASGLSLAMVHRAATESPALRKVWDAESRSLGITLVLRHTIAGADGAAVSGVLRARPELAEAVKLRKQRGEKRLGMFDLVMAQLVGDADLERSAKAGFKRESNGAELAIEVKLFPGMPREKEELDTYLALAKVP
jgi:hypothetical protein